MPLNIHPIFTHFPVALFTLYSFFELLRFKKITNQHYWFYVKACFVIMGTLMSYATYYTGGMIEHEFSGQLLEMHSFFASLTLIVYTIISVAYLVSWIEKTDVAATIAKSPAKPIWNFLLRFRSIILRPVTTIILAFVGLIAITITGALGGALAYGPEIDPVVSFIYHLLIKI